MHNDVFLSLRHDKLPRHETRFDAHLKFFFAVFAIHAQCMAERQARLTLYNIEKDSSLVIIRGNMQAHIQYVVDMTFAAVQSA